MSQMRLFDTATGTVRPFEPGPIARIYICGITPYDATHMGHAATYVTYDVLHRRLVDAGHEVRIAAAGKELMKVSAEPKYDFHFKNAPAGDHRCHVGLFNAEVEVLFDRF